MHNYNQIRSLSLEISSRCQAQCPMCTRNYHSGLANPLLPMSDITLEFFIDKCPEDFIKKLDDITLCGNFGDPILNNDLIPIIEYVASIKPSIMIGIDTNGSARVSEWWKQLAKVLPLRHEVRFGIDGLEDTHKIHRIGTDFNKILDNARAFIDAGGNASWCFIEFKHNEHQLNDAEKLSKEIGFNKFYKRQSSRFIGQSYFDVLDKNGNVIYKIEQPTIPTTPSIDADTLANYKQILAMAEITCESARSQMVHIDAQGYLWPCSFTAGIPYIFSRPEELIYDYIQDAKLNLKLFLNERFGNMDQLSLHNKTIKEIVNSTEWQTAWNDAVRTNCVNVCARVCGNFKDKNLNRTRNHFTDLKK